MKDNFDIRESLAENETTPPEVSSLGAGDVVDYTDVTVDDLAVANAEAAMLEYSDPDLEDEEELPIESVELEDASIPEDAGEPDPDPDPEEQLISAEEREVDPDCLTELLASRSYTRARALIEPLPPLDIAELFALIEPRYLLVLFRLLPKGQAADVFVEMDSDLQRALIDAFSDSELSLILEELYLDDTVDVIEEMPAAVVKRIVKNSTPENRAALNRLLQYDGNSAGAIMTTEYVRLLPDMTVGEALAHIRRVAIDKETIYTCYVTDRGRHLIGIVTARALLLSDESLVLSEIMEENIVFAYTSDDKEEVALLFDRYGFIALPVVDSETRLVGIVTVDDAIDVIREEAEEDFAKMAGITPSETTYIRTSVLRIFLSRIPWLLLLMVSATFSSTILGRFEAALPAVLLLFVPMLMDTGGNSGGQTSVTVIRSLSLGEVEPRDILRILWKELRVGLLAGLALGVVAFLKVMLIDHLLMQNPEVTVSVGLAVAFSLAVTIIISKIIGACLPILAKKVGFDPAVMASPFITTVVDAASLVLYFFISAALLGL